MAAMSRYALLLAPSANRVYADQAGRLASAELAAFGSVLGSGLSDISQEFIGGVEYLTFSAELAARDISYLSNLSSGYALFERVEDLLRPVLLTPLARYDSDLITIPKYAGKTNEQFTKLVEVSGLGDFFKAHGVPADRIKACLTNKASLDEVLKIRDHGVNELKVDGTPNFFIDGEKQEGVYDWPGLETKLREHVR